ncbi:MAG: hypothetical protein GXP33_16230, partial [Spirochaetes bacterium]|nr:hypothetical protein [Spirochaetota bacterium]
DTTPTWTWDNPVDPDIADILYHLDTDLYASAGGIISDFTPGSDLPTGDHTLYIKVEDTAGNISPENSYTVTIQ